MLSNKEKFIAPLHYTKYLVLSSLFFLIPAIYAYKNKLYGYSILLLFTSLISANYWRRATYSWWRDIDLLFAKISFITFVSNGIMYVRYIPFIIIGYPCLIILVYCFYLSNKLSKLKNNDNWYKYHMLFHFIMMIEQLIILNSIIHK